jgi:hypothetical protein
VSRRAVALAALLACGGQKTTVDAPPHATSATATVSVEPAASSGVGRIDPDAVRNVIRAARAHFLLCYAAGVKKKHDLAGRVETKFVIDETGHVISAEDVTHSNVLPDDAVRECIVSKFRNLEFPPPQPSGKVPITYPLLLDPSMVAVAHAGAAAPEATTETVREPRRFDAAGSTAALARVDLKACGHAGGLHGAGHVRITFAPTGRVSKVDVDAPAGAAKTAGGACVAKKFGSVQVSAFDGSPVTIQKSFRVP